MNHLPQRMQEIREREAAVWAIRRRVERHWSRMKSISPAMKKYLAERDIRAGLIAAGLPLPIEISFDEKVERLARMVLRDRSWLRGLDPKVKAAVLARLTGEAA